MSNFEIQAPLSYKAFFPSCSQYYGLFCPSFILVGTRLTASEVFCLPVKQSGEHDVKCWRHFLIRCRLFSVNKNAFPHDFRRHSARWSLFLFNSMSISPHSILIKDFFFLAIYILVTSPLNSRTSEMILHYTVHFVFLSFLIPYITHHAGVALL